MKIAKLISDNSPKIVKKAVNIAEKESAKAYHSKPQMSAARINLELRAEEMDAEDYIRMRSYLAEQEMASFVQNSIF